MQKGEDDTVSPEKSSRKGVDKPRPLVRLFSHHRAGVESTEMRLRVCEERVRLAGLDNAACVEHDHAVVIEDCVELVRDGDDGVVAEFLADDSLHDFICLGVDAVFGFFVSSPCLSFFGG